MSEPSVVAVEHHPILGSRRFGWADEADCRRTAEALAARPALRDAFIELHGPLGAGKTTFVRHLLRALGVQGRIKSPTYAVLEPYEIGGLVISHFDFYRFGDPREWADAGFRDLFAAPGLKLAEWPANAEGALPVPDLRLHIAPRDDDRRDVLAEALTPAGLELLRLTGDPQRRAALRRMGSLVLSLGGAQLVRAANGPNIVAVRVWPALDYTRVTIESDRPLAATHQLAEAPHRLVVDIDGLELVPALRELVGKVRPDDPFIARLRVGQYQQRVVRLVFDLKQAVQPPQLTTLAPVAAYQQRLVFDLFPVHERMDPLLALVREKEGAEQRAAQAVQDALGELIARIEERPQPPPAAQTTTVPPLPAPPPQPPATASERQRVDRLVIVAIDPGHGGEDPGAVGPSGLREKDVVLAVALALRDRLNDVSGMRAMLTRDADFFVPLHERVRKARRVQADLFVSIHADAFFRPEARGASVFALSTRGASSSAARWMAEKENAADQVGGVSLAQIRDAQVLHAMLDMSTTAQIKDSLKLGSEVLSRIGEVGRLHKRQVEQAGFAVLKAPDIPSILVETAFISNPEEEDKLRDPAYRAQLVDALASGIRRYFAKNPPLARNRQL